MATHLNLKGEPCNCGFGRNRPSLEWQIEANILDPSPVHPLRPLNELLELQAQYEQMAGEAAGSAAMKAAIFTSLTDIRKEIAEHGLRQPEARLNAHPDEWNCPHCDGAGCATCNWTGRWNSSPTEPVATEPSEDHGPVQISNDEPGVATIGA
jgi:hypothetical protein